MKAELLLREVEDALTFAIKYSDNTENGLIMMTKARAKTIISDIKKLRSDRHKASIMERYNPSSKVATT